MKIYLAGPMTGLPNYNFPAFDAAAAHLRELGHEVFSPAENDRDNGYNPEGSNGHDAAEHGFDLRAALKDDLSWICDHAEAVALLPGWTRSKGANAEVALANALGIPAHGYRLFDRAEVTV
ncbi:DUF4406 domain-containing protein [Arthrobacter sp. VKM Ac-2550]|uniref:DUF4406 domain-containing protein n=1 Tax=Crystallibacter permensis TaxID=1938888 RepID=UPI0022267037|nr:DUF4406 domain-containing protein [Arthrobacter sp. VKM Ac-2550]MCW2132909.1 protein of unknown function (DUF4406) [Arthrobacter sp. VKM Ac-2550]